jgi:two-component system response regulator AtoC
MDRPKPRATAITTTTQAVVLPSAPNRLALTITPHGVQHWPLPAEGEVIVGRADDCHIRLDESSVSRRHLALRCGHTLSVVDQGSGNGTWFGDQRLPAREPVVLPLPLTLRLGEAMLVVHDAASLGRPRHLHTHDYFESRVEDECARLDHQGGSGSFSVALIACSSASVATIEAALASALRAMDVVAMHAPHEHEVLLPDTPKEQAEAVCEAVRAMIEGSGAHTRLAVASYPRDGRTSELLLGTLRATLHQSTPPAAITDAPGVATGISSELRPLVERIAPSAISVVIQGESGAGKDVLARAIHALSDRRDQPFLALNCAAFADSLLESELFGFQRGAFTGAVQAKTGLLESAHTGTVFLDEIGDMSLGLQAKLLRVIESREVTRLGALTPRKINVRFISATHRDLETLVAQGAFRHDLYFRLCGVSLFVRPLRERVSEIRPLAEKFIRELARELRRSPPRLSPGAVQALERYAWPGNIRELRNTIERAVLLCTGDTIDLGHLPMERLGRSSLPTHASRAHGTDVAAPSALVIDLAPRPTLVPPPATPTLRPAPATAAKGDDAEREQTLLALTACGWNQSHAARSLGIARGTLISRMDKYGFARPRKRP